MNRRMMAVLAASLIGAGLVTALPAAAEPATSVNYPAGATTTRLTGKAFDTCDAPTAAKMQAWTASPYDGVGVYVGGVNRTCKEQANLTTSWVTQVSKSWRIIPIYLGRQAPCTFRSPPNNLKISASEAEAQGKAAATDAIASVYSLGMRHGSAIYYDMEGYDVTNTSCKTTVLKFLSAWTKELHRRGFVSGVYANLNQGAKDLSDAYMSTSYARPDALWIARYDGNPSLKDWTLVNGSTIPNSRFAAGQRGKQYLGGHNETWGGVTMNVDSNQFDAPVATVSHTYRVTSSTPLSARKGPSTSYAVVRTYAPGSNVNVRCQTYSQQVGTTKLWDKLWDGTFVTDYYVSTPSNTTWSPPLPKCSLPYQVKATGSVTKRTGPGTGYSSAGSLPAGALARVLCQKTGTKYGTTSVWNRLHDGKWVTDHLIATPSTTGFSKPIPRC